MAIVLIRQLDVFPNPERRRSSDPYVIVLQADVVSETRGVLSAPLAEVGTLHRGQTLYPFVLVRDRTLVLVLTEMAVVPRRLLRDPVTNLSAERDRIVRALDYLFTGA